MEMNTSVCVFMVDIHLFGEKNSKTCRCHHERHRYTIQEIKLHLPREQGDAPLMFHRPNCLRDQLLAP